MKAHQFLIFGLLLLLGNMAHAEGNCPPGYYPIGAPQGPQSCAPIPGYSNGQQQQQPRPPQWVRRWGAIATDSARGVIGAATDQPSKSAARQAAMADCRKNGGSPCKLEVDYDNECAALVAGSNGYNVGADTTLDKVIQTTMKICTDAKNKDCQVYYSACSMPVRVQ